MKISNVLENNSIWSLEVSSKTEFLALLPDLLDTVSSSVAFEFFLILFKPKETPYPLIYQ